MKRCPACSRVYDDVSLRFCLDDGTELVNKPSETPAPQTLVMPGTPENQPTIDGFQPPPPFQPAATAPAFKSKRQRNIIIWVLVLGLGLPFIGGVLVAGWLVFNKQQPLVWYLVVEVDPTAPDRISAVRQTSEVLANRLNALGLNHQIEPQGDAGAGRLVIRLPSVENPERIKRIIMILGKLELAHIVSSKNPAPVEIYATREQALDWLNQENKSLSSHRIVHYSAEPAWTPADEYKWVIVEIPPIVDSSSVRDAVAVKSRGTEYQVNFTLDPNGAERFGSWTAANINEYLAIILDDEVKSTPYIRSQITDQGQITGSFTKESAEDLALVLKAGALPASLKFIDEGHNK